MKKMYRKLMEDGFSMHDIDEMDIHWFFSIMDVSEKEMKKQPKGKEVPIDMIF